MDDACKTEVLVELRDHRRGLRAKLGNRTPALNIGPGGGEDALIGIGALRHGTLRACRMLSLQAEGSPDNGVELQEEEQSQEQAHGEY